MELSFFSRLTISLRGRCLFGVLGFRRTEEIKPRSNYSPNGSDRSPADRTSEECYGKATLQAMRCSAEANRSVRSLSKARRASKFRSACGMHAAVPLNYQAAVF